MNQKPARRHNETPYNPLNVMPNDLFRDVAAKLFPTFGRVARIGLPAMMACAVALMAHSVPAQEEDEIPPPENLTLETKDGLLLKVTWYAGTKGKNSVPIIMLHGLEGKRAEYGPLAAYLQAQGHAVLVPDLRGHGQSTKFKGVDETYKVEDLKAGDYAKLMDAIMASDIERCKKFLMERHNAGELNIELLCLVAAEAGTVLAMNWAVSDWSWPQTPTLKQGQDVKALVLLSPAPKIDKTAINTVKTLLHPIFANKASPRLAIMIAVGQQGNDAYREARKLHTSLEQKRGKVPPADAAKRQDLFIDSYETQLQGTKLLDPRLRLAIDKVPIQDRISKFIELRLVSKASEYPWESREPPK